MIIELVTLITLLTGGSALLHVLGLRGWGLPFLGFATGTAMYIGVGFVQVVAFLPTSPIVTLAVVGGAPTIAWVVAAVRRRSSGAPLHRRALWYALAVIATFGVSAAARWLNLASWSPDSFKYLMSSSLIAQGHYAAASSYQVTKRLVGVPLLHSAANLDGQFYLPAITPMLAIAVLGSLAWFAWAAMRTTVSARLLIPSIVVGVAIVASTNRFVFHAFYVNGHLLFAMLLLLIVASSWLLLRDDRPDRAALKAVLLSAIPALVVTRAEGSLVLALSVLPLLLSHRVSFSFRAVVLAVLGASTTAWQLRVVAAHLGQGLEVPLSALALLAFGVALLAAIPLLRWKWLLQQSRWALWGVLVALWLALAVLIVRDRAILIDSLRATVQNLVLGEGSWGWTAVMIALLTVLAIVIFRFPAVRQLSFALSAFVPLAFLLAYLRGVAFRVGDGDSLNRMVIQFMPLAVLLIVAAAAEGRVRWTRDRPADAGQVRSSA